MIALVDEVQQAWPVYSAGALAVLGFLVTASERAQKLLGPVGRWLSERQQRKVEEQKDLENLLALRHDKQIAAVLEEAELYRDRYVSVLAELKEAMRQNAKLAQALREAQGSTEGTGGD